MEAMDSSMEFEEEAWESAPWLTVERLGYMIAGLLAAALRFAQLGLRPLNEAEAVQALTGNVLAFTLAGTGDAVARWLPALAGVILVLLPYGLRHRLGRGGALAASFLLAMSPSALYFSRNLDGAIVVVACGLALVVGLVNVIDRRRPGYLYLAAGALGLGISVGSGIYTVLFIVVLFVVLLYLWERRGDNGDGGALSTVWAEWKDEKALLARAGGVLLATFGLSAMTFMLQPSGLGHAADLLGDWAKSLLPEAGGQPPIYPLLLLLRYELLVLVLGLVEIGRWLASRRTRPEDAAGTEPLFPLTAFLVFWALAALLVIVVSGHRPAGNVLLVVVPLALLAGKGVERAWRWISWPRLWLEIGVIALIALGLGVFLYLQIAAYLEVGGASVASFAGIELSAGWAYLILAGVALVALVLLWLGAWIWRGRSLLLGSGWLVVLVLLGLWCVKAMWGPAFARASDPRELMILQTTAPDVYQFVDSLSALSRDTSGDATTLAVTVDARTGPVVEWYLRDFGQQQVVAELSGKPGTAAAVSLAAQDLPIGETFRGQGFPLRTHWLPWGQSGNSWVNWLLFSKADEPVIDQEVVLWVVSEP
jgi:uncharacterized protein (TIGR03663 family)